VVVVSGLSDAERRAYLLADNRLTEKAGWDRAALAIELRQLAPLLAEAGLDTELTGFETPEIDTLMGDLVDPEQDPSDEPSEIAKEPASRRGDLWLLDSNRLLCGNAKDKADLRKLMGREHATMVFTDPPFTRNRIDSGSSPNTIRDARDVGRIDCARTALA
jgi:ParB-like chromosome segregation protein Spo0J